MLLVVIYHLGFRYQYFSRGDEITRLDRLTSSTCVMPCKPMSKYELESALNKLFDERVQSAIALAKASPDAPSIHDNQHEWMSFTWRSFIDPFAKNDEVYADIGKPIDAQVNTVFEICYCTTTKDKSGQFYEVDVAKHIVAYANDNSALMKKFQIK